LKTFVLDTNVILFEAESIFKFDEHEVVIPITVIEEVDHFKKEQDERGRNARRFARFLDELRALGRLTDGVPLSNGGTLRVVLYKTDLRLDGLDMEVADNRILAVACMLQWEGNKVFLVTKDVNLRVKADSLGVVGADYENSKVQLDSLYTGVREVMVPGHLVDRMYAPNGAGVAPEEIQVVDPLPNEQFILLDEANIKHSALGRYSQFHRRIVTLPNELSAWGLAPRNAEQRFALDLLLDDNIKLVTLVGKAGTGKTLLALAAGLAKVADECSYKKLLVSRPVIPMGKDIGYLPGDVNEKMSVWLQPIFDAAEYLLSEYATDKKVTKKKRKKSEVIVEDKDDGKYSTCYKELEEMGLIKIEPLMYIRGRSIPHQFMIVDEAANLSPHEIKTIVTRAGEGTKIVLTGDPAQIDNPYLDSASNGLSVLVEKMKGHPIYGHITLTKGERSDLAELASNIL